MDKVTPTHLYIIPQSYGYVKLFGVCIGAVLLRSAGVGVLRLFVTMLQNVT
jgi:hypothetical protein